MQIEMIEKVSPALKPLYGSQTLPMLVSETQVDLRDVALLWISWTGG